VRSRQSVPPIRRGKLWLVGGRKGVLERRAPCTASGVRLMVPSSAIPKDGRLELAEQLDDFARDVAESLLEASVKLFRVVQDRVIERLALRVRTQRPPGSHSPGYSRRSVDCAIPGTRNVTGSRRTSVPPTFNSRLRTFEKSIAPRHRSKSFSRPTASSPAIERRSPAAARQPRPPRPPRRTAP
jgi:hypothetical protein